MFRSPHFVYFRVLREGYTLLLWLLWAAMVVTWLLTLVSLWREGSRTPSLLALLALGLFALLYFAEGIELAVTDLLDKEPEQLHDPTPCTDWDVEQLRAHIIGWLSTFAAGFADPHGQAPRADLAGFVVSDDAVGEAAKLKVGLACRVVIEQEHRRGALRKKFLEAENLTPVAQRVARQQPQF